MSLNPGKFGGRIFFSRVDFVCRHLFSVCSTSVLLQWHVKDPGHSAKTASGKLHLNTHIHPWPKKVRVGWLCRCPGIVRELIKNELKRNSSGNTQPESPQLTEPLWTDPGVKSGIRVHELISTKIFCLKCRRGWMVEHFPKVLTREEKATTVMVTWLSMTERLT